MAEPVTCEIGIEIHLGAPSLPWLLDDWWRYTGPCAALVLGTGVDLRDFHGRNAEECILPLVRVLWMLKRDPDYQPLAGDLLSSLVSRLEVLLSWLARNSMAMVKVAVWPEKPKRARKKSSTRSSTASKRR